MFTRDIPPSGDNGKNSFAAQTRAAAERQLTEWVDVLRELVIEDIVYPDTITLLTQYPVSPQIVQRLEQTTRAKDKIVAKGTKAYGFWAVLRIQQPLAATIALIAKHLPDHIVSRFDVAIDWLTRDQDDADILQSELRRIGTQLWRGCRRRTATYKDTAYWAFGPRPTTRNIVAYSTRPSKIPPYGPCAHFDLRYFTARMCRQRGINNAADLLTLDFNKCLHHDLRFSQICWKLAGKRIDKLTHEVARREHERTLQDRKLRRRQLPAYGWIRLRHLMERDILNQFYDDHEWTSWADLAEAPVQDVLDHIPVLRDAAVHVPAKALVRSDRLYI